jgi:hypothetical protein
MSKQLQEPILDRGIRNTNFFNGRLLTAKDLQTEQEAGRLQRRQLGVSVGEGVARGLEVVLESAGTTTERPVVVVTKGLALNRKGQALELPDDERVALVRASGSVPPEAGLFSDCGADGPTFTNLQNGVYVLALSPASGFQEYAPTRGNLPGDAAASCGRRYAVEGVQFKLVRVEPGGLAQLGANVPAFASGTLQQLGDLLAAGDDLSRSKLRNLLANLCLGTDQLAGVALDPLRKVTESATRERSFYASYGIADALRAATTPALTDCDVPLAVIYWTGGTIRFVDVWAVRRRVYAASEARLSHLFASRRAAEGEARFFQFEEHLLSLMAAQPNPETLVASSAFRWLPPAGIVPLRGGAYPRGFSYEKFFQGKSFGPPVSLSGADLGALLRASLDYPPVDLAAQQFVQLYSVDENTQALSASDPPQSYVVFASQEMPHYSDQPRFASLCQTLRETRAAYRDFIQKSVFLGNVVAPEGLTARLSVTAALQAVMNAAGERHVAACRCNCVLTHARARAMMQDLYDVQKTLVSTMKADWGQINVGGMRDYAALLASYLDVAIPGSKPSLGGALSAQNLAAALDAQNAINGLSATWAGEVVKGNLDVAYQHSDRGTTLALNSTDPFRYTFRVTNKTDRALEVGLSAGFASRQAWNAGVTLETVTGNPISSVSLQPFNPSDASNPAAFADIVVAVTTPHGATVGDKGVLRLTASVPPPVAVGAFDEKELTVDQQATTEAAATVEFISTVDIDGSPSAANVGDDVTYTFHTRFRTTTGDTTRNFRFFFIYVSPTNASTLYGITFVKKTAETDTSLTNATQKATQPYPMTSGDTDDVTVIVRPTAQAVGHPLTFKVRVQSVQDTNLAQESQNFVVTAVST